jgi:HEAT repeat protein
VKRLVTVPLVFCTALLVAAVAAAVGPDPRPKASIDDLRALLLNETQSDRARIRAANLLGALDDPRAEAVLIEALEVPKAAVRFGAARALGRPDRGVSVEPLLKVLGSSPEAPRVRGAAAGSLGVIGDPRAVPVLLATRRDGSAEVRVAARQALLTLPSGTVPLSRAELLIEILTDREAPEWVRAEAARGLGETPDLRGVPPLIAALEEPTPAPRQPATLTEFVQARTEARKSLPAAAARALGHLGTKEAVPSLVQAARKNAGEVVVAALEALQRLRAPEAIPVAVDALGAPDPRARRWAALLLGELEARDARGRLRTALEDSDEGVRLQAARALVKLGDVEAVDHLVLALETERLPQLRGAFQDALAALAPVAPW